MQPQPQTSAAAVRLVRTMKVCFVVSGVLVIYLAVRIRSHAPATPAPAFELMMTLVGPVAVLVGFLAPKLFARVARPPAGVSPERAALAQWMTGSVFALACFDACMLFGFVLHMVRARVQLVELLLAAGLISMILWSPNAPQTTEDGEAFRS